MQMDIHIIDLRTRICLWASVNLLAWSNKLAGIPEAVHRSRRKGVDQTYSFQGIKSQRKETKKIYILLGCVMCIGEGCCESCEGCWGAVMLTSDEGPADCMYADKSDAAPPCFVCQERDFSWMKGPMCGVDIKQSWAGLWRHMKWYKHLRCWCLLRQSCWKWR